MELDALRRAADALRSANSVLVCAGSGLSAESGIPTFRGPDGIFQSPDLSRITHVDTFESEDREEMLYWYQARRDKLSEVAPNAGHLALIDLAQTADYAIATQNVDHLLEAASDEVGFRPEILHLHGSLLVVKCHDCGDAFEDLKMDLSQAPRCTKCGGPLRPGVVWFGENLPPGVMERCMTLAAACDVCLILGTSGLVYPAAALPEMAKRSGATLIEVNPNPSALSDLCDVLIRQTTGEALPRLRDLVTET